MINHLRLTKLIVLILAVWSLPVEVLVVVLEPWGIACAVWLDGPHTGVIMKYQRPFPSFVLV